MKFSLGRSKKLKSNRAIGSLFRSGKLLGTFPLRVVYLEDQHADGSPLKVLFSVSKRQTKLAVNRHRTRRLMSESYRKHQGILYRALEESEKTVSVGFMYLSGKPVSYQTMEKKIVLLLHELADKIRSL